MSARPKQGEWTGLVDKNGKQVHEGSILSESYNQFYGHVRTLVYWAQEKAAFCSKGDFENGAGHNSINGEHFNEAEVVGHIDSSPEMFYPAKEIAR